MRRKVAHRTGDKIAGATGTDVKLRAGQKLGGRAEALAPHPSYAESKYLNAS
jgi:hypothetical protein